MDKMIESTKELMEEQMPSFDFLLDEEAERNSLLAEHRAWLKSICSTTPCRRYCRSLFVPHSCQALVTSSS